MLINRNEREVLNDFFRKIRLKNSNNDSSADQLCKIEQIISYLEVVHSIVRGYSKKRKLVFIESCAGSSYLSFLVYYFYTVMEQRNIIIHCVDRNVKLINRGEETASKLGFNNMFFHGCDVFDFTFPGPVDLAYSLHACDNATDRSLYLGLKSGAKNILSVSCCQHYMNRQMRNPGLRSITRHNVFKERMLYMAGDSMRALLLEMAGYRADIFEFVSSRYTDKNIMLRARKGGVSGVDIVRPEYEKMKNEFRIKPELEDYIKLM